MGRLTITCPRCGMTTVLRDNGYEDPAATTRCAFCGSGRVRREGTRDSQPRQPRRAA